MVYLSAETVEEPYAGKKHCPSVRYCGGLEDPVGRDSEDLDLTENGRDGIE